MPCFHGGARIRSRICLSVAQACGGADETFAVLMAAALELIHGASLVHDDLPCFDDADARCDKPSVHKTFGESTAKLVGDAIIILAFEILAEAMLTRLSAWLQRYACYHKTQASQSALPQDRLGKLTTIFR